MKQIDQKKNILICGSGIAGPTLAFWLAKQGHKVTVVERASSLRLTGQTVDIRDEGRDVVERMGLLKDISELMTNEEGLRFVDSKNIIQAEYPSAGGKKSFVTDIEILRADLSTLLLKSTQDNVEYIFGDYVTSCHENEAEVIVNFKNHAQRTFDLMVIAEGMRSSTRELVFGKVPVHHIGLYTAYFAMPYQPQDGTWVRWSNCTGGKSILLRPDQGRSTRAYLYIRSSKRGIDLTGRSAVNSFIKSTFRNDGWEAPRILEELDKTDDIFFEDLGQIRMDSWSRGRVVLLGDAAYCATPVSGMGTTLSIVGAYILAKSLLTSEDHHAAYKAYEQKMRPYVQQAQSIKPWTIRLEQPSTKLGIALFYRWKRLEKTKLMQFLMSPFGPKREHDDFLGAPIVYDAEITRAPEKSIL